MECSSNLVRLAPLENKMTASGEHDGGELDGLAG
jgi:hypothetical protein